MIGAAAVGAHMWTKKAEQALHARLKGSEPLQSMSFKYSLVTSVHETLQTKGITYTSSKTSTHIS